MAGHCITLLGGICLSDDPVPTKQLLGLGITLISIIIYSYFKFTEKRDRQQCIAEGAANNNNIVVRISV